ncbi:PEP-CTERM sorting domain-containing protein [bacterium]|nr:PEP-CTERM sorting domain-containing protein [bacterium]
MFVRTVFMAALLVAILASGALGSIGCDILNSGDNTTYTYSYLNNEESYDTITALHVFAPVDSSLITTWTADTGWDFSVEIDPTGASDIYWYTGDPINSGIDYGEILTVSMTVPSAYTTTVSDYVLEDFPVGNWGYDAFSSGGTWIMLGSVDVPSGTAPEIPDTPEPASIIALISGCAALIARRKRL